MKCSCQENTIMNDFNVDIEEKIKHLKYRTVIASKSGRIYKFFIIIIILILMLF